MLICWVLIYCWSNYYDQNAAIWQGLDDDESGALLPAAGTGHKYILDKTEILFSRESDSTFTNVRSFVRPQNPSTAWNHHPSSFFIHPSFISRLLSFSACFLIFSYIYNDKHNVQLILSSTNSLVFIFCALVVNYWWTCTLAGLKFQTILNIMSRLHRSESSFRW